jgi:DNA cross-link repair 1B protein
MTLRTVPHSNLLLDDFDFCKGFPRGTFLHLLSHWHADHYQGLSPCWDYSPIYCTGTTARLLQLKFPKVHALVVPCPYDTPIELPLPCGLKATATFIDAGHIPGSAMILLRGYFGTVLFTGDFRFSPRMFESRALFTHSPKVVDHRVS